MAELATIARPYAEALHRATAGADAAMLAEQLGRLAAVADDPDLREFAGNPKTADDQVFTLICSVAGGPLDARASNLLRAVIDNRRLAALPEIAAQFHALVDAGSGVAQATIQSAFPITEAQTAAVVAALEKRFSRKLDARVEVTPELIGGIRVVVGDEVLDTSVRARLEQMKMALSA